MAKRNDLVRYLVDEYFDGDAGKAAKASGFTKQQVTNWIVGRNTPNKRTISLLLHPAIVPEFKVIAEYKVLAAGGSSKGLRKQLASMLSGHDEASGLYAFYDSMLNLIYLGKSDGNLLNECYQQLRASVRKGVFPKGAKQPGSRLDVVRYVSAYYVRGSDILDYAKHVESLVLRISKPILNKNTGKLRQAE